MKIKDIMDILSRYNGDSEIVFGFDANKVFYSSPQSHLSGEISEIDYVPLNFTGIVELPKGKFLANLDDYTKRDMRLFGDRPNSWEK